MPIPKSITWHLFLLPHPYAHSKVNYITLVFIAFINTGNRRKSSPAYFEPEFCNLQSWRGGKKYSTLMKAGDRLIKVTHRKPQIFEEIMYNITVLISYILYEVGFLL